MMDKGLKRYLFGMAMPILILFSMTALPIYTLYFGEEILLKTRPFDPRDLFRGDYVILDYEISEIGAKKLPKEIYDRQDGSFYEFQNKDIFVILKKGKKYYEVDYVTLQKPSKGLYLKGKIQYFNTNLQPPAVEEKLAERPEPVKEELISVVVDYSLDKYFVPENTGTELEKLSREGQLAAKVRVFNGYALLTKVLPL